MRKNISLATTPIYTIILSHGLLINIDLTKLHHSADKIFVKCKKNPLISQTVFFNIPRMILKGALKTITCILKACILEVKNS